MRFLSILSLYLVSLSTVGQVVLDADGPGNTYSLITSVLAPGHNPIEVPDCNHAAFGDHIDEVFDADLNTNVFRFHIHVTPDNDRCINTDRQRNEIKAYDKSPDNLLGIVGEKVIYKWKFKLSSGFQSSPNFTHIHQLKSVGGPLSSMPMYTLTTRKGSPDRIELRYAETDTQITLTQTALSPFIDTWLEVTETIEYGTSGTYDIEIKRVSDNVVLLAYSDNNIINWRSEAEFVRPKWGIYRSLNNAQDLRDENVLFANFSVEEVETLSTESTELPDGFLVYPNPSNKSIQLKNIPKEAEMMQMFTMDGKKVLEKNISRPDEVLDVSQLKEGLYMIKVSGSQLNQSKLIIKVN